MKRTPLTRKTPLKPSHRKRGASKPRNPSGFGMVRRVDLEHLRRIRALPCIACELAGIQQTSPTESHHIRRDEEGRDYGRGQKAHDDEAIPLCHEHHWNGVGTIYTRKGFEAEFGNERDLLEKVRERLGLVRAA